VGSLSPRANGLDDVESGQLVAGDVGEVDSQRALDAAERFLRQAQRPRDAGRRRAAVPRDDDRAARTNDSGDSVGPVILSRKTLAERRESAAP